MNKKIIIKAVIAGALGFALACLCMMAGPLFPSLLFASLASFVALNLAILTEKIILYFVLSAVQWALFVFAIAHDIDYRQGRSRMSLATGGLYIALCLACLPISLYEFSKAELPVVMGFHALLGVTIAVLPLILTFNQQKRKVKYLLIISIITVILTVSLGMYIRNKPTGCWYSVTIEEDANVKIYDLDTTGWNTIVMSSGTTACITVPAPEKVIFTWKTALPGGEEYLAKQQQLFDEYLLFKKDNPNKEPEHDSWDDETYPKDKFQEHKATVVLKGKVPKRPNGDIIITYVGDEKFEVEFKRDNHGVNDSDMKRQNVVIENGALDLSFSKITDKGLGYLKNTKEIEVLLLQGTDISDSGLKHLSLFPNLVVLNLNYVQITGKGFENVKLDKLKYLSLEKSGYQEQYLENLSNFENLNAISLIRTNISGISGLQNLKKLRRLNLAGSPISDIGLQDIATLENLEQLTLYRTNVSDKGIKYLIEMKSLKSLRLGDTDISDNAVQDLSTMPSLVYIELSGTRITDEAIEWISKFPKLESVNLRGMPLSKESLKSLKQKCPNLEILTWLEI